MRSIGISRKNAALDTAERQLPAVSLTPDSSSKSMTQWRKVSTAAFFPREEMNKYFSFEHLMRFAKAKYG